jgi:hypothetical protein
MATGRSPGLLFKSGTISRKPADRDYKNVRLTFLAIRWIGLRLRDADNGSRMRHFPPRRCSDHVAAFCRLIAAGAQDISGRAAIGRDELMRSGL